MIEPNEYQRKIWASAITAVCLAALGFFVFGLGWLLLQILTFFKPLLIPMAVAGIIAYILEPVVSFFQWRGLKRTHAVICIFILGLIVLGLVLGLLIPRAVIEINRVINNWDMYWQAFNTTLDKWSALLGNQFQQHPEWLTHVKRMIAENGPKWINKVSEWLLKGVQTLPAAIMVLFGFIMVPLYLYYFLVEKERIESNWKTYVPLKREWFRDEFIHVLEKINKYLIAFFRGQVLVALCIGVLTGIGLSLIGMDFALLIGLLTGVLSIVPYLGLILSIIPALLIAYLQTQGWIMPGLVVMVFVITQMIEGFLITPKIMGDRVGLHPLTIIIAILFWGQLLGGMLGAMLAIPLTATLRVLCYRYILESSFKKA